PARSHRAGARAVPPIRSRRAARGSGGSCRDSPGSTRRLRRALGGCVLAWRAAVAARCAATVRQRAARVIDPRSCRYTAASCPTAVPRFRFPANSASLPLRVAAGPARRHGHVWPRPHKGERMTPRLEIRPTIACAALLCLALAGPAQSQTGGDAALVEVHGGTAAFAVDTNISAISVHGKSTALEARLRLRQSTEGAVLEGIEAAVPVKTIGTGMGMRDEHMRKYIFTTSDGQVPDIRFAADKAACGKIEPGQPTTCQVSGTLAIRGTARP